MIAELHADNPYKRDPRRDTGHPDAWRYYGGNRGLAGAWEKGRLAALDGKPDRSPYPDRRTYRGGVTFSRAFRKAWSEGWHHGMGLDYRDTTYG